MTKCQHESEKQVPGCGLNVEFILKVNLDSFPMENSDNPDTVNVLGVVLRVVRGSYVARRIIIVELNEASTRCKIKKKSEAVLK